MSAHASSATSSPSRARGGVSFHADLHIHSRYSRACSRDCDLEHLAWWARRKGIWVVGTGDFTHPAWAEELRDKLVPAEPGLFRLRPEIERDVDRTLPPSCGQQTRFMLSVEISTIYKRAERTRKVHHLIYVPDFDAADRITRALGRIGNLASDGRPILGLDSRDLLEITLESDPGSYLVPAHAWTPWFSVLGSKSGFDAVEDCYADLAEHIFAIETGLSSDPPMNWRVSGLDRYRLVSNSDAHSPPMLGREASMFATDLDYFAMRRALETGDGYRGTAEFFPEEGKYHLDGHRKCGVRLEPPQTREHHGCCPVCEKPLTVGVLHRVEELADRAAGARLAGAADYRNLVPLPEMVGEILGMGPKSKKVSGTIAELVARLGPELRILDEFPVEDVEAAGGPLLAEAISRLRRGEVIREGGYDGEYGVIRLFSPDELRSFGTGPALFDVAEPMRSAPTTSSPGTEGDVGKRTRRRPTKPAPGESVPGDTSAVDTNRDSVPGDTSAVDTNDASLLDDAVSYDADADAAGADGLLGGLDPEQRAAAAVRGGPLLIIAGPGTGKTRTLTHRVAHLVTEQGVPPERCLAITFTRRACDEMRERLTNLAPAEASRITVTTFHALGLRILREQHDRVGLSAGFRVADDAERLAVAADLSGTGTGGGPGTGGSATSGSATSGSATSGSGAGGSGRGGSEREARRLLAELDRDAELRSRYEKALREHDLVDFDDLIALPVRLFEEDPELATHYGDRFRWISVDEYQDVDERQYRLLRLLTRAESELTAIGDPDQAIYRFRGADVSFFLRFRQDFPAARVVQLRRNYRSSTTILSGAMQAVAPTTLVPDRTLRAVRAGAVPARIGVYPAADEHAEASFVARTIDQLLGGSSFHSLDSGRVDSDGADGLSFADMAVLYRTDAQARAVMDALTQAGVPFQKRSHDRLVDRPGVRTVVEELPHHAGPLARRIRAAAEAALARTAGTRSTDDATDRAAEVRSAAELLAPLAERCADDLERFLTELALGAEVDTWDPRADRVSLLTLHAAKGLEFDVVFLVGCEDGLLPLRWPGEGGRADEDAVAEERRLLFVGMTRAQSYLFLSHARQRVRGGALRDAGPSPFLSAIDDGMLERLGSAGGRRRAARDRQLTLM